MMLQNASIFESSWTVISVIGCVLFAIVGWFAVGDRRYVRKPRLTGIDRRALSNRTIIATQNMSIALLLGGIDACFAIAGVIAMLLPNTSSNDGITKTGAVFLGSFFLAHVCLIGVAVVLLVSRSRILAKAEADYEHLIMLQERAGVEAKK